MVTLDDAQVRTVDTVVQVAAKAIGRSWRDWVGAEDVAQHLWEYLLKRPRKLRDLLQVFDPKAENMREHRTRWRYDLLRVGERYARKQKAEHAGYVTADEYFYNPQTLLELLGEWFGYPTVAALEKVKIKHSFDPAEGGGKQAQLADVQRAWEVLDVADQDVLERFVKTQSVQDLSRGMGVSDEAARRRMYKALRKMRRFLGGRNPW